jgi:hypothetical protein
MDRNGYDECCVYRKYLHAAVGDHRPFQKEGYVHQQFVPFGIREHNTLLEMAYDLQLQHAGT